MLEIQQLLAGRDFALNDSRAAQMVNFVYLLADTATRQAALVDAAWDAAGLAERVRSQGLELTALIATHGHPDHVGGDLFGMKIEGAAQLIELVKVPIWAHELEVERLTTRGGVAAADVRAVKDDQELHVGETSVRCLHTPGHTPGGMCLFAQGNLLTGDTLFVEECGRVDLPGSEPDKMFESMRRLAALPGETVVWPGHCYGSRKRSTIAQERVSNPCLQPKTLEEWRAFLA